MTWRIFTNVDSTTHLFFAVRASAANTSKTHFNWLLNRFIELPPLCAARVRIPKTPMGAQRLRAASIFPWPGLSQAFRTRCAGRLRTLTDSTNDPNQDESVVTHRAKP